MNFYRKKNYQLNFRQSIYITSEFNFVKGIK